MSLVATLRRKKDCRFVAYGGGAYVSLESGVRHPSPDAVDPQTLDDWFDIFRTLQFADIGDGLAKWVAREKPQLGPGIAERMAIASNMSQQDIDAATKQRRELSARSDALPDDGSVLMMPTVPGAALFLTDRTASR